MSLSDVFITSPSIAQVLSYNGTKWINQTIPNMALSTLSDTSKFTIKQSTVDL